MRGVAGKICKTEMNRKLNITVMLGGPSAEREVSLRTGAAVARALRSLGHEVHELDPQTPMWALPPNTDAVFLALHGSYGEDGTVQKQLDGLGVPYTGCDADSSRIAFDKVLTKQCCLKAAVPTGQVFDGQFARGRAPGKFCAAAGGQTITARLQRGTAICRMRRGLAGGAGRGAEI